MADANPNSSDRFARDRERERDFLRKLEEYPITEITGLVDGDGPGEHRLDWALTSTLIIPLVAWKEPKGATRRKRLYVRLPNLGHDQLTEKLNLVKPFAVLRLKARFTEKPLNDALHALLLEFLELNVNDSELASIAAELQEPKGFRDPQFGEFVLDRKLGWYQGKAEWCDAPIDLVLEMEDEDQPEVAAKAARQLWNEQANWHARVLMCAVKELLETAHKWAREGNEEPPSPEDFKSRMTLESITVHPDGRFAFWFDDGGLFLGHAIAVRGSLEEGPTDASVEG